MSFLSFFVHSYYNDTNVESSSFSSYHHNTNIFHSLCVHSIHFILFFFFLPPSIFLSLYACSPLNIRYNIIFWHSPFAVRHKSSLCFFLLLLQHRVLFIVFRLYIAFGLSRFEISIHQTVTVVVCWWLLQTVEHCFDQINDNNKQEMECGRKRERVIEERREKNRLNCILSINTINNNFVSFTFFCFASFSFV